MGRTPTPTPTPDIDTPSEASYNFYAYYTQLITCKSWLYKYRHVIGAVVASIAVTTPLSTWWRICLQTTLFLMKCIGQTLSLGFGLGLAMTVVQKLTSNSMSHDNHLDLDSTIMPMSINKLSSHNSYASQSQRVNNSVSSMRASVAMSGSRLYTGKGEDEFVAMYPNISSFICKELGVLTDFIVRDFVKSWYCKIDSRCMYNNASDSDDASRSSTSNNNNLQAEDGSSDFIVQMHRAIVSILGALATVAGERANLCNLVLIKYIEVIALEVRTYRSLHFRATQRVKQRYSNKPEDIAVDDFNAMESNSKEYCVGLEYVLRRRVHPALVYNLDTGNSTSRKESYRKLVENDFKNMNECELNYLRMISKELCKILLCQPEWNSKITRTLCVEVLAGCVLLPIMQLISLPEYYNQLIVGTHQNAKKEKHATDSLNGAITNVATENDDIADHNIINSDQRVGSSESLASEYIKLEESNEQDQNELQGSAFIDNWISKAVSPQEKSDLNDRTAILPMLTLAIIEVQSIISLGDEDDIRWETPECRTAVCQLVLSIEAALQHGKLQGSIHQQNTKYSRITLCGILMELTEDLDSFELLDESTMTEEYDDALQNMESEVENEESQSKNDLATLRTLIATWLQTGMVHQILSVFVSKEHYILDRLYADDAFFKSQEEAQFFVSQLKIMDGIEILVDTMALLSAEPYRFSSDYRSQTNIDNIPENSKEMRRTSPPSKVPSRISSSTSMPSSKNIKKWWSAGNNPSKSVSAVENFGDKFQRATTHLMKAGGEIIGTSAPIEVKRSAEVTISNSPSVLQKKVVPRRSIGTSGSSPKDFTNFRPNTEIVSRLRMERQRRLDSWNVALKTILNAAGDKRISNLSQSQYSKLQRRCSEEFYKYIHMIDIEESKGMISVEAAGSRRAIEVPDVDSSLLSRASSRLITPIGEHRNPRLSDQDYRSYAVSHEQNVASSKSRRANLHSGTYVRRALLRYYPNDRTATVDDPRWTHDDTAACNLPRHFKVSRQPLNKIRNSGKLAGNLLNVGGDSGEFVATPRTGKSVDFVYRMSLFQVPQVEVGGVRFKIHDAVNAGCIPRADASSRELSDASITAAIIRSGTHYNLKDSNQQYISAVLIRSIQEQNSTAFTPGHLRGVLWRASTLQQCHLATLLHHTRNNTIRSLNSSSNKNEAAKGLKPTLLLLHFASSRVKEKERLCRDLGLGYRHVALDYLERKGLYRRKRTHLVNIKVDVLDSVQYQTSDILGSTTVEYKLRVRRTSLVLKGAVETNDQVIEEWCIFRRFTDFTLLNKCLRSQIAEQAAGNTISQKLPNFMSAKQQDDGLPLIPTLNNQGKVPGTSSNRFVQRRMSDIQLYLDIILSRNHLLRESHEVMQFLAAIDALPKNLDAYQIPGGKHDDLGRSEIRRSFNTDKSSVERNISNETDVKNDSSWIATGSESFGNDKTTGTSIHTVSSSPSVDVTSINSEIPANAASIEPYGDKAMEASIIARISEVKLVTFQKVLFDFVSYTFHLDKATFFRSSVVSAVWRMAFVITGTTSAQFTRNLTKWHFKLITGESLGAIIRSIHQSLWPEGAWYTPAPVLSKEEKKDLANSSRNAIDKVLPDQFQQVRSVLGDDFDKGIDTLHDMIQNRVVLKSLAYTLLDLVLLEVFPELKDHLGVLNGKIDMTKNEEEETEHDELYNR